MHRGGEIELMEDVSEDDHPVGELGTGVDDAARGYVD